MTDNSLEIPDGSFPEVGHLDLVYRLRWMPCISMAGTPMEIPQDDPLYLAAADEIERLRKDREDLALAICGGEDAPGYANAQTVEALVSIVRENYRDQRDRAEAAEAKLATAREALSEVITWADDLRLFSERGTELAPVFQKAKTALNDTGGGG